MAKQQPDIVIDRLGTHLFKVTRKDGTSRLSWDWDKLLEEVAAISAPKKNLVAETEIKVAKTRAKKADETNGPEKTNTAAKSAPAKKPAAKKTTSKSKKA